MSMKLRKIFELPKNLYQEGSPIIVTTSFLSVDNSNGNTFVELNATNISPKTIVSAFVEIISRCNKDASEADLTKYSYSNLHCKRNEDFGKGVSILLPNNLTRNFSFRFTKIVFDDESTYEFESDEFDSIPALQTLESKYDDYQLIGYSEINSKGVYVPLVYKDLRICTCGEVLRQEENTCTNCGGDFNAIYNADPESMKKSGIYSAADKILNSAEQIPLMNSEKSDLNIANVIYSMFDKNKQVEFSKEDIDQKTSEYKKSLELFESISGWKDSNEKADICRQNIESLSSSLIDRKNQAQEETKKLQKKVLKVSGITIAVIVVLIAIIAINNNYIQPLGLYNQAIEAAENGKYQEAYAIFESLGRFKDSREQYNELKNAEAQKYLDKGEYDKGYSILEEIGNFGAIKESKIQRASELLKAKKYDEAYSLLEECENYEPAIRELQKSKYERGTAYLAAGDFEKAYKLLGEVPGYKDSDEILNENKYVRACTYLKEEKFDEAYVLLGQIQNYKDSKDILIKSYYDRGVAYLKANDYEKAYSLLEKCTDYADSKKLINESYYQRAEAATASENFSEAISLYKKVDAQFFPDASDKLSVAEKLSNIKSKYNNGYYKASLSLCNQLKGNRIADKYAAKCQNKISIIESYCGIYKDVYSRNPLLEITYDYNNQKMIINEKNNSTLRDAIVSFDPDNPYKKLYFPKIGNDEQYYYQFTNPGRLEVKLAKNSDEDAYLKQN